MDSTPQRMSAHWLPRPITSNDPSPLFSSSYLVLDYGTFSTLTMWHILWYVTIGQLLYVVLPKPINFQLMVLKTHSNNHLLLQMLSNPSASHHSGCAYVDQVHHLDHVLTCVKLTAPVNQGSMPVSCQHHDATNWPIFAQFCLHTLQILPRAHLIAAFPNLVQERSSRSLCFHQPMDVSSLQ